MKLHHRVAKTGAADSACATSGAIAPHSGAPETCPVPASFAVFRSRHVNPLSPLHTYCTNIHPGESWDDLLLGVWPEVLKVKECVSVGEPFPVGLRLSALAASQVTPRRAREFGDLCQRHACFIPTINGFPYGMFHNGVVKESVYAPDWRDPRRVKYTLDLVRLLRCWLPDSVTGSISSVPIGYGRHLSGDDLPLVRRNLLAVLEELEKSADAGKTVVLALEPEPGCVLENAADVVAFFDRLRLPSQVRPLIGVCFDCCHAATVLENPAESFALFAAAGIPVPKIHVSSAAVIRSDHRKAAGLFQEPRYLHQTTVINDSGIFRYSDLCHALDSPWAVGGEWRIHFHLPIFDQGNDRYGTTNGLIKETLAVRHPDTLLEIETYTYDVMAQPVPRMPLTDFISREFAWLRSCL